MLALTFINAKVFRLAHGSADLERAFVEAHRLAVRRFALHAHRDALAPPAVAAYNELLACQQNTRRAQYAVKCALSSAMSVIKKVFCTRIVDRYNGIKESAGPF